MTTAIQILTITTQLLTTHLITINTDHHNYWPLPPDHNYWPQLLTTITDHNHTTTDPNHRTVDPNHTTTEHKYWNHYTDHKASDYNYYPQLLITNHTTTDLNHWTTLLTTTIGHNHTTTDHTYWPKFRGSTSGYLMTASRSLCHH